MNTIKILKNIITVGYYWLLLNFILEAKSVIDVVFFNKNKNSSNAKIIGEPFDMSEAGNLKILIIGIIALSLFVIILRAVFLLKGSISDLSSGHYFSDKIIKNFKAVGIYLIICGVGEIIGLMAINMILLSKLSLSIDDSVILFIIIGLFFMFLSEVFNKARNIQQENNLTI